jgi:hypothetical protein
MAINILLSVLGVIEYSGPPDEEYYIRDPAMISMIFVTLSILACTTAIMCGLPLISILKKFRKLSSLALILGATILGSIVLPIELAIATVLFDGVVTKWSGVLIWAFSVGAAAGGVTAFVFLHVVGTSDCNHT